MAGPLSSQSILQSMVEVLPTHPKGDTTSDLSSSYEAIALFAHACMVNLGFRLLGFNEDKKIEAECERLAPRLPPQWNSSFGSHAFVYAHAQSSMQFVLKVDRLGGKAEIRALAVGDERIHRFEIVVRDFISSNALPVRIPFTPSGDGNETEDRTLQGGLFAKLRDVFINDARMKDLADLIKLNLIQKILPKLQKEGYEETPQTEDDRQAQQDARDAQRQPRRPPQHPDVPDPLAPNQPYPVLDPQIPPPRRPIPAGDFPPPDFEDPYDLNRPRPHGGPLMPPGGRSPFNIGDNDLYPPGLGPHDPLRGSFGPGVLPRPRGGGMHPTFDDPLFQGPGRQSGDDDFDPQIPPGARWDPVGPGFGNRGGSRNPFGGPGNSPFGGGFGGGII